MEKGTTCTSAMGASDTARHGHPRQGTVDDTANADGLQGSKTRFRNKAPTWESPVLQRENLHTCVTQASIAQSQKDKLQAKHAFFSNMPSITCCHLWKN